MLMKEIVEIEVVISYTNYNDPVGSAHTEKFFFSKQPTDKQLVEAMRHALSDRSIGGQVALSFMAAVKNLGVPEKNNYKENDDGTEIIYNNTTLYFEVVDD